MRKIIGIIILIVFVLIIFNGTVIGIYLDNDYDLTLLAAYGMVFLIFIVAIVLCGMLLLALHLIE